MTNHELLSALSQLILQKDRVSSLALADALSEAGLGEAEAMLRKGMVGGVRIVLPKLCDWPKCGNMARQFRFRHREGTVMAVCDRHNNDIHDEDSHISDSNCSNCGCEETVW